MKKQRLSLALNVSIPLLDTMTSKNVKKRHNDTPTAQNLPPKIARREPIPNIIEPTGNDQFLIDIEQQELSNMLNNQTGLGLSQMPHTSPPSSPPPVNNNNDPRQQEFERFFQTEQPWEDDNELRDVYFRNFELIRDIDQVHRRTRTYNRYLNGEETTLNEAMEHAIEEVYRLQNHSFKINLSFSAIFQNRETQEYKFYYASHNTKLLDKPKLIQSKNDLNNLLNFLSAKDFPTHLRNQRPNTKWVLEGIVNLQIRVFPTTYPLGNPPELQDYIKNYRCVIGLEKDQNHAYRYTDHLCFFCCLAVGKFGKTRHNCNGKAKELFNQYCEHFQITPDEFKGIELEDFYTLENFYEVQLFAMSLKEDGSTETIYLKQVSRSKYS